MKKYTLKQVQHHHLIIRMETEYYAPKDTISVMKSKIIKMIKDIKMKPLGKPNVYYQDMPHSEEGMTGLCALEKSHVSFHFWNTPDIKILHHKNSNSLLQFDIYTCSILPKEYIKKIIKRWNEYNPTVIDIMLLNRQKSIKIDKEYHWNADNCLLSTYINSF